MSQNNRATRAFRPVDRSRGIPEDVLLRVVDLHTRFRTDVGTVEAVDGVSFDLRRGEVFAIVGESGSGKSITAMSILGLVPSPPGSVDSGQVIWKGKDLLKATPEELRSIRGRDIAMIFQDPMTALNPVHTVGRQIGEVVRIHEGLRSRAARRRAVELLGMVGIPRPESRVDDHPHEGGINH